MLTLKSLVRFAHSIPWGVGKIHFFYIIWTCFVVVFLENYSLNNLTFLCTLCLNFNKILHCAIWVFNSNYKLTVLVLSDRPCLNSLVVEWLHSMQEVPGSIPGLSTLLFNFQFQVHEEWEKTLHKSICPLLAMNSGQMDSWAVDKRIFSTPRYVVSMAWAKGKW